MYAYGLIIRYLLIFETEGLLNLLHIVAMFRYRSMKSDNGLFSFITMVLIWVLLFSFVTTYYCDNAEEEHAYDENGALLKLRQVIMVFRHGMRWPSSPIFNSNKNSTYYPEGYGQLTKVGKAQIYEMGQKMRCRYYDLITPYSVYVSDDVKATSTNVDRCFDSAALLLAGLYPPRDYQIWNQKLKWQPVPIITSKLDKSYVLMSNRSACPLYIKLLNAGNDTSESTEKLYRRLSNYVNFSNDNETRIFQMFIACDNIVSEIKMNISQPDWVREIYPDLVINFLKDKFNGVASSYELKRLFSGPLLGDIVTQMNGVLKNDSSKIVLYAGHDTTIAGLLHSLDLQSFIVPDYGSSVIFELYSSKRDEYYVKILYNEDTSFLNIKTKVLQQCGKLCPLDKFIKKVKPLFISEDEWNKKCFAV